MQDVRILGWWFGSASSPARCLGIGHDRNGRWCIQLWRWALWMPGHEGEV